MRAFVLAGIVGLALAVILGLSGCASTELNVGLGTDVNDYATIGSNPVGYVEVVQPIYGPVALTYLHISSVGGSDHDPLDMFSVRYQLKGPKK